MLLLSAALSAQNALWRERLPDLWRQYDNIQVVNASVALFQQGEKWGLMHLSGTILTPAQYEALAYDPMTLPGYIQIRSRADQSWGNISGVMNEQGQVIVPPQYRTVRLLPNGHLRACGYDKKCHDFTPQGKEVTSNLLQQYFSNGQEQDGIFAASEDGYSYGLMNQKGRWILQPIYHELHAVGNGWWNNMYDYPAGRLIHPNHTDRPELEWANTVPLKDGQFWHKKDGVWGQYNAKGKFIAPLDNDLVPHHQTNIAPWWVVQKDYGFGLTDDNGTTVLPPDHHWFQNAAKDSVFIISNQQNKQGGWKNGRWVIPQQYDNVFTASKLYFAVSDNHTDVYDLQFARIATVPLRLGTEQNFSEYFIDPRQINDEFNSNSTTLFPENRHAWSPVYGLVPLPDDALFLQQHYFVLIARMADGSVAGIGPDGAIRLRAEEITPVIRCQSGHGAYLFRQNGYWGVADHQWKVVIPAAYDELYHLEYDRFAARKGALWGVLKGEKWEIAPQYEQYQVQSCFSAIGQKGAWIVIKPSVQGVWNDLRCGKTGIDATAGTQKVKLAAPNRLLEGAEEMEPIYQDSFFIAMKSGARALAAPGGALLTPFAFKHIAPVLRKYMQGFFWATTVEGQKVILDSQGKEWLRGDDIKLDGSAFFNVKKDDKWRFYGLNFQQIGENEAITPFMIHRGSGYLVYQKAEGLWGIATVPGREIHTFEADEVKNDPPYASAVSWRKGSVWYDLSLPDLKSTVKSYEAEIHHAYVTVVKKNGLYGMNRPSGEVLFPCEYNNISVLGESRFHFGLGKGDTLTITDHKGQIVVPASRMQVEPLAPDLYNNSTTDGIVRLTYHGATSEIIHLHTGKRLPGGHQRVIWSANREWLLASNRDGLYNIYDTDLNPLLEAPAVYVERLCDSLFAVKIKYDNSSPTRIFNVTEKKYWPVSFQLAGPRAKGIWRGYDQGNGYIYCGSRLLFSKKTGDIDIFTFSDVRSLCYKNSDGWRLCDATGQHLTAEGYNELALLNDYYYSVKKQGKKGLLNKRGQIIIAPEYEEVMPLLPNLYMVQKSAKWGVIDVKGSILVPVQCRRIQPAPDGFITVKEERYAFYDVKGQPLFQETWEYADQFSEGLAAVRKNGKWGYINRKGEVVIPYQFEYAHRFRPQWRETSVIKDGQFYDINHDGNIIRTMSGIPDFGSFFSPLELLPDRDRYESYINIGNGFEIFTDKKTRKMGLINYAGVLLLPAEYDHLEYAFQPDVWLTGKKGGKTWKINPKLQATPE